MDAGLNLVTELVEVWLFNLSKIVTSTSSVTGNAATLQKKQ